MPAWIVAAPLTPKGEPSARAIASTARASSSRRMTIVASLCGRGSSLNVASRISPSVPCAPQLILTRSRPVTFFTTRPPRGNDLAEAVDQLQPKEVVAHGAGGDAARAGERGRDEAADGRLARARQRGRAGPSARTAASGRAPASEPRRQTSGVPALARRVISAGSWNTMPVRRAVGELSRAFGRAAEPGAGASADDIERAASCAARRFRRPRSRRRA